MTVGLHDALAAAHGARVVNVSSANHVSPVVFDDEQGAATTVFAATAPLLEGVTGRYFQDSDEPGPSEEMGHGVAAHATDEVAARRLWDLSTEWLRR